ncbi:radical SAM protein [Candidatus Woesearchaeota archaeon]|nr:radical SAM protein [Candidatus Woesearchaeota archaeon]
MTKSIYYVNTNNGCNNSCIGCGISRSCLGSKEGRDYSEIVNDLNLGKKKGFKIVHIAGGENTIQKNYFDILKKAKQLYKEVYTTTNGRMLSYKKFAAKLIKVNPTSICISLYGHNKKLHEEWSQTPNSFNQTVKGIINMFPIKDKITINVVLWRKNYKYLSNILSFIKQLGIKSVCLLNILPTGRGKEIYDKLYINLKELSVLENSIIPFLDFFHSIEIEDFPLCVFSREFRKKKNVHIKDLSTSIKRDSTGEIVDLGLFMVEEMGITMLNSIQLIEQVKKFKPDPNKFIRKINTCKLCKNNKLCKGIFVQYLKTRKIKNVEKELSFLINKNNYM